MDARATHSKPRTRLLTPRHPSAAGFGGNRRRRAVSEGLGNRRPGRSSRRGAKPPELPRAPPPFAAACDPPLRRRGTGCSAAESESHTPSSALRRSLPPARTPGVPQGRRRRRGLLRPPAARGPGPEAHRAGRPPRRQSSHQGGAHNSPSPSLFTDPLPAALSSAGPEPAPARLNSRHRPLAPSPHPPQGADATAAAYRAVRACGLALDPAVASEVVCGLSRGEGGGAGRAAAAAEAFEGEGVKLAARAWVAAAVAASSFGDAQARSLGSQRRAVSFSPLVPLPPSPRRRPPSPVLT